MEIIILLLIIILVYLVWEYRIHSHRLKRIPVRITVTGTRGKSSIVRTLASVFRNHGKVVLAKTTGTEAKYILPDGQEARVKRFGKTSIIEQKKLVRKASGLNVDFLITEIMSIHPEYHRIETHRLLKPNFTIISNFRPDHTHVTGRTPDDISKVYVNDIFPSSTVLVHDEDVNSILLSEIKRSNSNLVRVKKDVLKEFKISGADSIQQFSENLDLVIEAARHFGINENVLKNGIENTQLDIGRLELFRFTTENKSICFVNSFAANDPASTIQVIQKVSERMNTKDTELVGLLSLRSDRGERSQQWLDRLVQKESFPIHFLYLVGAHKKIFSRKFQESEEIRSKDPAWITNHIISKSTNGSIVFGMGNFHGMGKKLLEFWKEKGSLLSDI